MKKWTVFLVMLMAVSTVWAQNMGSMPGMQPEKQAQQDVICEKLDLTSEQIEQLQDLRLQHKKEVIPYQSDLRIKRIELQEMLAKGESEKNLVKKNNEINEIKAKLSDSRLKHELKVREIVGTENYKILRSHGDCHCLGAGPCHSFEKRPIYRYKEYRHGIKK
ncbi:MAG: hypothetical protein PHE86_07420 [Candidatus Marinimicrobia bacterium]|nr:hypothetical protein [Candidatus Neomarinimicrobiota bacterium]MDD5583194.1 hypothetical protein [Candidatus Neomarinimicrobiota bacterium]